MSGSEAFLGPINLEVEARVSCLGIHLDGIQEQFKTRLKESKVARVSRDAVGNVDQ